MSRNRTYFELSQLETFEERFQYLKLGGITGLATFGWDRWVNQRFYKSHEWQAARDFVIVRDNGCDLGVPGYEIHSGLLIHHMNPLLVEQIRHSDEAILDPNFLITVSHRTHNAIHYGNADQLPRGPIQRKAGDTKLW